MNPNHCRWRDDRCQTRAAQNVCQRLDERYVREYQPGARVVFDGNPEHGYCVGAEAAADSCAVCMDEIELDEMKTLPCGHYFHQACIDKWAESKKECPNCGEPFDGGGVNSKWRADLESASLDIEPYVVSVDRAAELGAIDALNGFLDRGIFPSLSGIMVAARNNHIEVFQSFIDHDFIVAGRYIGIIGTTRGIDTNILRLLAQHSAPTQEAMNMLAGEGSLDAIRALAPYGVPDAEGANWAAIRGRLEVVKYLHRNHIDVTSEGVDGVVENGHYVDMIRYLMGIGIMPSQEAINRCTTSDEVDEIEEELIQEMLGALAEYGLAPTAPPPAPPLMDRIFSFMRNPFGGAPPPAPAPAQMAVRRRRRATPKRW